MTKATIHKEQIQYLYDNQSWLYDYVFAFFYGSKALLIDERFVSAIKTSLNFIKNLYK